MSSNRRKVLRIGEFVLHCRTVLMLLLTIMFVERDTELNRLRQVTGQLQEEKEKASGRAEKLAEDLEGE